MDQLKTNSFVRKYIRSEAKRGFDHNSIVEAFWEQFDVAAVGAKYVTMAKVRRYSSIYTSTLQTDSIAVSAFLTTYGSLSGYDLRFYWFEIISDTGQFWISKNSLNCIYLHLIF